MAEALAGSSPSVPLIDMAELELRLETLMANYRDALRIAARLPRIGRLETTTSPSGSESRRWVIGPFVRIFVESHVRSKVDVIVAVLSIEATPLIDDRDEDTKKLKSWTRQLKGLSKTLRGWAGSFGLLTKAPLMTALLPLFGAILTQLVGISFSGWDAFGSSVTKLGQSAGKSSIVAFLELVAIVFLYTYVLFSFVVVGFGFRCKRAIFSGGRTEPDLFRRDIFSKDSRVERWRQIPQTNIYHAENALFETLRIKKRTEFPLDIVATFTPYFVLVVTIVMSAGLYLALRAGHLPSIWQVVFLIIFLFLLVNYVYSAVSYYRERIRNKVV